MKPKVRPELCKAYTGHHTKNTNKYNKHPTQGDINMEEEAKPLDNVEQTSLDETSRETPQTELSSLSLQERTEILTDPKKLKEWLKKLESADNIAPTRDSMIIKALTKNQQMLGTWTCHEQTPTVDTVLGEDPTDFVTRFVNALGVRHLVGIQPMVGPVGLIYTLQNRPQTPEDSANSNESPQAKIPTTCFQLCVVDHVTEAVTRKLQAGYTFEAVQDLKDFYGLDLGVELRQALAAELASEYNISVYQDLMDIARNKTTLDLASANADSAASIADVMQKIGVAINLGAQKVGVATRRGTANWIVVDPLLSTIIQCSPGITFEKCTDKQTSPTDLVFTGTINETIKMYTFIHAAPNTILYGYKGQGDSDVGYVLAPYVIAMNTGIIIHPTTFEPVMRFATRYSSFVNNGPLVDGGQYYGILTLQNMPDLLNIENELEEGDNPAQRYYDNLNESRRTHHLDQFENAMRTVEGLKDLINSR